MFERNTTISSNVYEVLQKASTPLSVSQIMEMLKKKKLKPHKTTIYRILEKLIAKNSIAEVNVRNGATYYEFCENHHHHFVCTSCDQLLCLKTTDESLPDIDLLALLPSNKFKIQSHDFSIYGLCEKCTCNGEKS